MNTGDFCYHFYEQLWLIIIVNNDDFIIIVSNKTD